jgi:DNA sulfur modification protein DndD
MVTRDDEESPLLTDRWDDLVEELLPLDISSLFFFDGEKIEALADPERASKVVATAVESLLGLNLIDRLGTDLIALERRKRSRTTDSASQESLRGLEVSLRDSKEKHQIALQEQAARRNVLDRAEAVFAQSEQTFRQQGGELFERRSDLERHRSMLNDRLRHLDATLIELASGPLPLRIVQDLLNRVEQQRQLEITAHRAAIVGEMLEERDAKLMAVIHRGANELITAVDDFLTADRAQRSADSQVQTFLHGSDEFHDRISFVLPKEIDRVAQQTDQFLRERKSVEGELDECDRQLAAVPPADALAEVTRHRDECARQLAEARAHLAVSSDAVAKAEQAVNEHEAALQRAYADTAAVRAAHEDSLRIIDHAGRVRETLAAFRRGLLERHLNRIEAAVLDSLRRLLRKENLVHDLRIDPSSFQLDLFDAQGERVPTERLSAGERQLLAVAILWGLARVSGRQLPMVIDTPLGRLDSSHRRHIVERYFPSASHQVLLLSTDEEIDEELLRFLASSIGRRYELRHDDAAGCTEIVDGYFWEVASNVA